MNVYIPMQGKSASLSREFNQCVGMKLIFSNSIGKWALCVSQHSVNANVYAHRRLQIRVCVYCTKCIMCNVTICPSSSGHISYIKIESDYLLWEKRNARSSCKVWTQLKNSNIFCEEIYKKKVELRLRYKFLVSGFICPNLTVEVFWTSTTMKKISHKFSILSACIAQKKREFWSHCMYQSSIHSSVCEQ